MTWGEAYDTKVALAARVQEFYNKCHSEEDGKFCGDEVDVPKGLRKPGGGATIDPNTGKNVREGYAVAVDNKYSSITPVKEFFDGVPPKGKQILRDWVRKNAALLKNPNIKIGLWHDDVNGEIVIDASEQVMDRSKALSLGRKRDQQGIYHLVPGGEGYIDTGGSGGREEVSKAA